MSDGLNSKIEQDVKVGIFVTIGIAFAMIAILVLGGSESIFKSKVHYTSHFSNTTGLLPGAKIVLSGLNVGVVKGVEYDGKSRNIKVTLSIESKYSKEMREGSTVEMLTQGVLGDKYLSLNPGRSENIIPENGEISNIVSQDLSAFLSKGDQLLLNATSVTGSLDRLLKTFEKANRLDSITEELAQTAKNLNKLTAEINGKDINKSSKNLSQILEKINQGNGTLGALINDPSLYEDVRSMVGGANRNRIIRNLVRKTVKDADK